MRTERKQRRGASAGRVRREDRENRESAGEGGSDEALSYIAEQAAALRRLARRHRLDVLDYLLGMTQLEAEERLRSKHKLS